MTHKQANTVKELATPVNKVLEGLKVEECKRCEGKGYMDGQCINYNYCKVCRGLGKIPYTWTPQVGEWVWDKKSKILKLIDETVMMMCACDPSRYIPILGCEIIEKVLQKAGYIVDIWNTRPGNYYCEIDDGNDNNEMYKGTGNCFQKAVMEAVLELGENK